MWSCILFLIQPTKCCSEAEHVSKQPSPLNWQHHRIPWVSLQVHYWLWTILQPNPELWPMATMGLLGSLPNILPVIRAAMLSCSGLCLVSSLCGANPPCPCPCPECHPTQPRITAMLARGNLTACLWHQHKQYALDWPLIYLLLECMSCLCK